MLDSEKHFNHLSKLLEFEEADEFEQFKEEFLKRSPEERELTGKALLHLRLAEMHYSPGGHHLLSFSYADGRPLPLYSPDTGDIVSVSREMTGFLEAPTGTVYDKSRERITVAFDYELPDWMEEDAMLHINITSNRATYRKMQEATKQVKSAGHTRLAFFRDLSLGLRRPESYDPLKTEDIRFFNERLNPWQKEAVKMAMASRDIALVHGPPGTGKTTVLIEIIRQAAAQEKFVFATAPSNTACDHLLECLVAAGIPALRLGHPARIMEHLRDHTLDFKLAAHPHTKAIDELEAKLHLMIRRRERQLDRRRLSGEEKREAAHEIRAIQSEIRGLENRIFSQVVHEAPVMIGTHASATDPIFKKRVFDLLVMDEASQSTEPSSWIPLLRAEKVVLAGDHFQLPPTVRSKKAEQMGLGKTLFERVHGLLDENWKTLLRVQYRMHEKIMNFSSKEFYDGKLIADESVRSHTLADLSHMKHAKETEEPFIFLDTAGRGFEEALEPGSESRFNREEAGILITHLARLLELGLRAEEVAVISPYSAQVRLLASLVSDPRIEVDSVDGFQGREKEVVLLSLVRSNLEGELGFLADTRRMNVAMTRARRKLVVIGDSATLASIPFYRDFMRYAESIGAYRSVWEEGG